jgi:TPR repeat protein
MLGKLRGAVRLSPDSAEDRLKLADALYRIGDIESALDEYRVAIRLQPDNAQAHLQLCVTLMAKQDWRAAATALKEAIRLNPELTQAQHNLGSAYYSLGNPDAAILSYRRALELRPNFPDARYRLALVLKLTKRDQEAAQFMEEAATGGVPQAQYFMGNAYRNGQGVEKNLARAIGWWTKAAEFGHQHAVESLSRLRRQALSLDQPDRRRKEALEAFKQYRDGLWAEYPDIVRNGPNESLGMAMLNDMQATNGVSVLLTEGYALSKPAHDELARLYEVGLDARLAQFDPRILSCVETLAADGFLPSKKALARIYGKGLGVAPDLPKAKSLLKGLPKQDVKSLLDEIAAH